MSAHVSHTSSGEWQSFEARMRRRRAERCILRAEVAAQEGSLDEARAAIEEARRLAPGLAEIDTVEANIFGRDEGTVPAPPSPRSKGFLYAAAVLACLALSVGFAWWQHTRQTQQVAAPVPERAATPGPSAAVNPRNQPRPARDVRVETFDVTAPSVNEPPVVTQPAAATIQSRTDAPDLPITAPDLLPRTIERELASHREPAAEPALRREPVAIANLNAPVPALREVELASTPTASAASSPIPAPPPPRIDENSAVRTVLHRYADAYSRLDASAAQQVWPGVNRAALSRAFESLASQDISLGNCAVNVSGASARATCAGAATWAPKVGGGGARTEQRAWTFQLAKADAGWQIVNARVQNR
jgi:hypothetical protein